MLLKDWAIFIAIDYYQKALEINPQLLEVKAAIAEVSIRQGKTAN